MEDTASLEETTKYLASVLEVESSRLIFEGIGGGWNSEIFLDGHQTVGMTSNNPSTNKICDVRFYLPPSIREANSYAPFSLSVVDGYSIERVCIEYKIGEHPEFKGFLEELNKTKRIPKEKLNENSEISVYLDDSKRGIGHVPYTFGNSEEARLCIQVDYIENLEEYVPEAKNQTDQGHYCIHGDSTPFFPFNPSKFDKIRMNLSSGNNPRGEDYLKEFLDGLKVPSDGLELWMYGDRANGIVDRTFRYSNFLEVLVRNPRIKEHWNNLVEVSRRMEKMFEVH